jgi:hypothetical protein
MISCNLALIWFFNHETGLSYCYCFGFHAPASNKYCSIELIYDTCQHHCAVSTAACWLVVGKEDCQWNRRTVAVVVAARSRAVSSTLLYAKLLDTTVNYCEGGLFLVVGTYVNGPLLMTLRTMFAKR